MRAEALYSFAVQRLRLDFPFDSITGKGLFDDFYAASNSPAE